MKGDFSRLRFNKENQYTSVLAQQGRVSLDADSNEQCAIDEYLRATETIDVVGPFGGPAHNEGFGIGIKNNSIEIGAGRYYVEGILCENFGELDFGKQPCLINPNPTDTTLLGSLTSGKIDSIQVYLEVWQRFVTGLDDPCLLEPALGLADTTGRRQSVWRVLVKQGASGSTDCCDSISSGLWPVKNPGRMGATTGDDSGDCTCEPTPAAGYRGIENQLYRVEIHEGGDESSASFKWSRENGSVVVEVNSVSGKNVVVDTLGPDPNLGFASNDWVEIYDDSNLFGDTPNQPGNLYQIQGINPQTLTVTMYESVVLAQPSNNPRMRRWDQIGSSAGANGIPLSTVPVSLENGIEVQFEDGNYRSGDYWLIPARTATGEIEWPPCGGDGSYFQPALRTNIYRAPLACISLDSSGNPKVQDCRKKFYPLTELEPVCTTSCCTHTVGDGITSCGDFKSIQTAIDCLPPRGGEVCILPGIYYENVFIFGKRDVVISGCGWQTRVASESLQPDKGQLTIGTVKQKTLAVNPFSAVFTIVDSQHIVLKSFAVEAADDEVGVLIDGTETVIDKDQIELLRKSTDFVRGTIDIAVEGLVLTAAEYPAVLAMRAELLRIDRNRVAMRNVRSQWPAIYASGKEIHIERNRVGIPSRAELVEWLPFSVQTDLLNQENPAWGSDRNLDPVGEDQLENLEREVLHPGTIQIGGPSRDVYVLENAVQDGSGTGIALGSFEVLDPSGNDSGIGTGVTITLEGPCDNGTIKGSNTYPPKDGYTVVGGGVLVNVQIHRNRIRNMGMCGIGPVTFFDLTKTLEVISIVGLNISGNEITNTVLRVTDPIGDGESGGYAAICVPDVQHLTIRDNTITNFGFQPGADACGIFVLHGEMVDIAGNQILETRDWSQSFQEKTKSNGPRGGILLAIVTPPTFPVSSAFDQGNDPTYIAPIYEPGLPAVRIENNVVRVPCDYSLAVLGCGSFSILGNHLACGGAVTQTSFELAQTVLILNWGASIELDSLVRLVSDYLAGNYPSNTGNLLTVARTISCGDVLFANNVCQLEASVSGQTEFCSIFIFTADHLSFSNNQSWVDASVPSGVANAILIALTLNVLGNRFQEAVLAVPISVLTLGAANVTAQNIATHCIFVLPAGQIDSHNIVLIKSLFGISCDDAKEQTVNSLRSEYSGS